MQNARKFLVAATFEKANAYVFAGLVIMNSNVSECGENCVGLRWKLAVMGAYKRKGNGLRSAVNVSKCGHNVTGALLGCRFHNPKVGGSIPPPGYQFLISFQLVTAEKEF